MKVGVYVDAFNLYYGGRKQLGRTRVGAGSTSGHSPMT